MIHHFSIPARDPHRVATVLAKLLGGDRGRVTRFGPYPGGWSAWSGDRYATGVEVYPVGAEMVPGEGAAQAQFVTNAGATGRTATHAAISVDADEAAVMALAAAEGWRAVKCWRGGFHVIELWVENTVMLEILTPEMAREYLGDFPA